jgi:putative endonuclease
MLKFLSQAVKIRYKMFYYVYVLENNTDEFYVGFAPYKLEDRVAKHNQSLVASTKHHAPWNLIFFEAYLDKEDALRREKYFKTSSGRRALKFMLKEYRSKHKIILN